MNDAVLKKSSGSDDRLVKIQDQNKVPKPKPGARGGGSKEVEPSKTELSPEAEEERLMAEIRTTAETADRQALEAIQGSLKEAKRAVFEPELPPDVEDAGVVNPVKKAEEVVEKGTTIELPASEEIYKRGLSTKISGKGDDKSIVGVSSISALAIFIGRLLKMAHKHAMKVIFRKGGKVN